MWCAATDFLAGSSVCKAASHDIVAPELRVLKQCADPHHCFLTVWRWLPTWFPFDASKSQPSTSSSRGLDAMLGLDSTPFRAGNGFQLAGLVPIWALLASHQGEQLHEDKLFQTWSSSLSELYICGSEDQQLEYGGRTERWSGFTLPPDCKNGPLDVCEKGRSVNARRAPCQLSSISPFGRDRISRSSQRRRWTGFVGEIWA